MGGEGGEGSRVKCGEGVLDVRLWYLEGFWWSKRGRGNGKGREGGRRVWGWGWGKERESGNGRQDLC